MEFGEGRYIEGNEQYAGKIMVDKYKLYLRGTENYTQTYIAVDRIRGVRVTKQRIEIEVVPSPIRRFIATIIAERQNLKKLVKALAERANLKKRFLKSEWVR